MQLVAGCHNIAGRSRTCSEYKDDFLLALNAFGCLLQCAQRLRLLPTLAQRARLLRLPIASAPPCRRRLSVASIVCASLSKTTFPWCGFDRGLGRLGRRAGGCCLARQLVDDLRAALVLRQNYTSCSRAEACTPPSDRCVPPEIVRSRATDARVDWCDHTTHRRHCKIHFHAARLRRILQRHSLPAANRIDDRLLQSRHSSQQTAREEPRSSRAS